VKITINNIGVALAQLEMVKSLDFKLLEQLFNHDLITFHHSLRVADLLYEFGTFMNLQNPQIFELYTLGVLHDIGKLLIPKDILNKKEKLTITEKNEIFKHTIYGYDLLKDSYPDYFIEGILYHHENLDGSGYEKLKGVKIPYMAKILRIVDSFDAMTNNRSYQKAIPIKTALEELEKYKGKWYEPNLVDSFIRMMKY
jgi:HD-GYP domain-containing protein (c-di-GMP phosphodiesterase class II)